MSIHDIDLGLIELNRSIAAQRYWCSCASTLSQVSAPTLRSAKAIVQRMWSSTEFNVMEMQSYGEIASVRLVLACKMRGP